MQIDKKYQLVGESERFIYYACNDGNIYKKHSDGTMEIKKSWVVRKGSNEYIVTKVCGKDVKVRNLIAKSFIREYKPGYVVLHKNKDIKDCRPENLIVMTKKQLGKLTGYKSNSKKVGLYENGKLVQEFRSSRVAGKKLNCSYQMICDYCNNKPRKYKEFDVRWI